MATKVVFTVRIIYKSGAEAILDCTEFQHSAREVTWEIDKRFVSSNTRPIFMNVDDIAAVWQLDAREVTIPD